MSWTWNEIDPSDKEWGACEVWNGTEAVATHVFGPANARMIAAAPDLLEALADLAKAVALEVDAKPGFGGSGYLLARLTDAKAALAKARGE